MHLEEFADGRSVWHRMDPRIKIVGLACFAVVSAISDQFCALALALFLGALALLLAKLETRKVLVRLVTVNTFVAMLWVFLPIATKGEPLWDWGFLTFHREGVELAAIITLKANAVVSATIALLGTSTVVSLVHALLHLKVPANLAQLFFFCYRYISVIHEEYLCLRGSMKIRCFAPRTDSHTYRSLAYLMGMLFVRSYDRSQRIYQAMVLRGFDGTFWTLDHFHMHNSDWLALAAMILCSASVAGLQAFSKFM